MAFDPKNTVWKVAAMDSNGNLTSPFHPTPWHFDTGTMSAAGFWTGTYKAIPGYGDEYACTTNGVGGPDAFKVVFVSSTNFVATKNGAIYRFGIRL